MTPRINEASKEIDLTKYSETLLGQLNQKKSGYKLNGEGPVTELIHPAVLKTEFLFRNFPEQLNFQTHLKNYHILAFENRKEAEAYSPETRSYSGFPWEIYQFLIAVPSSALIHFEGLGSIYLSKTESFAPVFAPALHHYTLPIYMDYALSEELWGPAGKWVRFHERLHTLFTNSGLLLDQDFPGFYPLKKEATWLEKSGFLGQHTPEGFVLIMTWDFPLSGLVELEKVLARGP